MLSNNLCLWAKEIVEIELGLPLTMTYQQFVFTGKASLSYKLELNLIVTSPQDVFIDQAYEFPAICVPRKSISSTQKTLNDEFKKCLFTGDTLLRS